MEAGEAALQHDESEFQKQVAVFEKRMADLALLGAKVQAQSASVAEQYARLDSERALIEAARAEAQQVIDSVAKASQSAAAKGDQLRAEKSRHTAERTALIKEQTKFKKDKENALKHIVHGIATRSSSSGHMLSPSLDLLTPTSSLGVPGSLAVHGWPTSAEPAALSQMQQAGHSLPGGAGLMSPSRLQPASGDLSAALASLSSHATQLRGFMMDEKILDS